MFLFYSWLKLDRPLIFVPILFSFDFSQLDLASKAHYELLLNFYWISYASCNSKNNFPFIYILNVNTELIFLRNHSEFSLRIFSEKKKKFNFKFSNRNSLNDSLRRTRWLSEWKKWVIDSQFRHSESPRIAKKYPVENKFRFIWFFKLDTTFSPRFI